MKFNKNLNFMSAFWKIWKTKIRKKRTKRREKNL